MKVESEERINDLKLLGLDEEATLDQIEAAYDLVLQKRVAIGKSGNVTDAEQREFDNCSSAYNRLLGKSDKKKDFEKGKWFTGFNLTSLKNFWYVYNWQAILVSASSIILISILVSVLIRPVYDMGVCVSDYVCGDQAAFEQYMHGAFPGVKEILYLNLDRVSSGDTDIAQADNMLATRVAARQIDIFIMKNDTFLKYAKRGYFQPLDGFAAQNGIIINEEKDCITATELDSTPCLYGLHISGNERIKQFLNVKNATIGIAKNTARNDLAHELLMKITGK